MWTGCVTTGGSACGTWCQVGARDSVGRGATTWLFVDALLWMARSGARWRDLPERFGDHGTVKRRYYRWIERGALGGFLAVLTADAELEWLMIHSTVVRAHQHASGARVAKGGLMPKGLAAPAAASAPSCTPPPTRSATRCACCSGQGSATTSRAAMS